MSDAGCTPGREPRGVAASCRLYSDSTIDTRVVTSDGKWKTRTYSFRFLDDGTHGAKTSLHALLVFLGEMVERTAVVIMPLGVDSSVVVVLHLATGLAVRISCAQQPSKSHPLQITTLE